MMYQTATLFTYYHELGHLIQKSPGLYQWLSEKYEHTGNNFNFLSHIYEFDADMHAANSICFHPIDWWERLDTAHKNQANLERILSLSLASTFSYFIFLMQSRDEKMYYYKHTHPHPLIRITYILTVFIDVAKKYFPSVDQKNIFNEALKISSMLFQERGEAGLTDNYIKTLHEEYEKIVNYIESLIEAAKDIPNLATNTVHKK